MALGGARIWGVQHSAAIRMEKARREYAGFRYRQVYLRTGCPRHRQEFYSRDGAGRTVYGGQRLDEGFKLSHYPRPPRVDNISYAALYAPGMFSHQDRDEWRQRQPWPAAMRFTDALTERVLEQHLPPRPDPVCQSAVGCATGACSAARFAEDEPSHIQTLDRQ
jgi:hypothetical protein